LGRPTGDLGVDRIPVEDLGGDQLASQSGGVVVPFLLRQMALEDRIGSALPEVRLEHGREREPPPGPPAADPVSPRHHRPGR
jgi:hypothetical protein